MQYGCARLDISDANCSGIFNVSQAPCIPHWTRTSHVVYAHDHRLMRSCVAKVPMVASIVSPAIEWASALDASREKVQLRDLRFLATSYFKDATYFESGSSSSELHES